MTDALFFFGVVIALAGWLTLALVAVLALASDDDEYVQ